MKTSRQAFGKMIGTLKAALNPAAKIPKEQMDAWYLLLGHYPENVLKEALARAAQSWEIANTLPPPGFIVKQIRQMLAEKAQMLWLKLKEAIFEVGSYDSVILEPEVMHILAEYYDGWVGICSRTVTELEFIEKDFCEKYIDICLNPEKMRHITHLPGLTEIHCRAKGFYDYIPDCIDLRGENFDALKLQKRKSAELIAAKHKALAGKTSQDIPIRQLEEMKEILWKKVGLIGRKIPEGSNAN